MRYILTSVAPWRFERRDLSGPRISGTCAKIGGWAPQGAIKQNLLRRVGDVIGAANHVRDAHVDVVDDDAELVHGHGRNLLRTFGRAEKNEVFDFVVVEFAVAEHGVVNFGVSADGNRNRIAGLAPGVEGFRRGKSSA